MRLSIVSPLVLALVLAVPAYAAEAAAAAPCREVLKQGRTGGFISFKSEAHARELLDAEARRFCRGLGTPQVMDASCRHDPPVARKLVVEGRAEPLQVERRERWYCSGEVSCPLPEQVCGPLQ